MAFDGVERVFGIEGFSAVELDTFSQLEYPLRSIAIGLPRLGEIRLRKRP